MFATDRLKASFMMKGISITALVVASVVMFYVAGCGGESDVNENDSAANDDSGAISCAWTNDGECDEPEGTDLCPEGSDVTDCTSTSTGGDDDDDDGGSNCGEPCPDGCCSLSGAICCQPPFCSGNCIGSPCC